MVAGKPLTARQKRRIAAAVDRFEDFAGLQFVVYVGAAADDTRAAARDLLDGLGRGNGAAIAVLVDPTRGRFELLPGDAARRRLADHDFALAAAAMQASFGVGDLTGGIVQAISQLALAARPLREGDYLTPELPDLVEL